MAQLSWRFSCLPLVAALLIAPAAGAQSVPAYQMGTAQPNDLAKFIRNGQIRNASGIVGDNNGVGVNPFSVTDNGQLGFCSDSEPTNGPYAHVCIGHDTSGNAVIDVASLAGEPAHTLKFVINGTVVPFPPSGLSLVPPVFINDNITGPQTADRATMTVSTQPGISASQIYQWISCASACAGAFSIDALRGVNVATDASTNVSFGVAGWLVNNDTNSSPLGQAAAVAAYGVGNANGSATWGFNSLLSDHQYLTVSADTGKFLFNEFDFNITSPHTQGGGLNLGGTWLVQPAGVNAFGVTTPWGSNYSGPSSPFAKWANGFITQNGCCQTGINLGSHTFTPTNSDPSQNLVFTYRDAAGTQQNITLAAGNGLLFLGGSSSYGLTTPDGGGEHAFVVGRNGASDAGTIFPAPGPPPTPPSPGANNPSQYILFNYNDSTNHAQNYSVRADNAGVMAFLGTATTPTFGFVGNLFANRITATDLVVTAMPTSCSSQPTGTLWNSGGTVHVC